MSNVIVVSTELGVTAMRPVTVPEVTDMFCSALTGIAQQVLSQVPEDEQDKVAQEMFDLMNNSFSKCLDNTFPNIVLRGDLTEEAILKAENEILTDSARNVKAFKPKTKTKSGKTK